MKKLKLLVLSMIMSMAITPSVMASNDYVLGGDAASDFNQSAIVAPAVTPAPAPVQVNRIVNVIGLDAQQTGYNVTYQYFNVYQGYSCPKYFGVIEIQNTSAGNLYLGTATFDIYNSSGSIVASDALISSVPDVIAPGEKGYFYNYGYLSDLPMAQYTLKPTISVKPSTLNATRYPVSGTNISAATYGGLKVVGTVNNNTTEDKSYLFVECVLYDENDLPIGFMTGSVSDLKARATLGFETTGYSLTDDIKLENVKRYEVIAAPTQFQF